MSTNINKNLSFGTFTDKTPKYVDRKTFAKQLRENQTPAERCLAEIIRDFNEKQPTRFYQQVIILDYIVDFYFPEARLAVEVDGLIHDSKKEQDEARQKHLEEYGVKVLRFTNEDVLLAGYYAKWSERQASKKTLAKHEAVYQLKFEIREKIRETIYNRLIEWSVGI